MAQDNLLDIEGPESWDPWLTARPSNGSPAKLGVVFDMERSGVGLT